MLEAGLCGFGFLFGASIARRKGRRREQERLLPAAMYPLCFCGVRQSHTNAGNAVLPGMGRAAEKKCCLQRKNDFQKNILHNDTFLIRYKCICFIKRGKRAVWVFESTFLLVYCGVFIAVGGAVFGSFLNCAAWRIAHRESFLKGRSHCPSCGHVLGAPDLVPVLSWVFLKGKCRYCGEKVSPRYPATELLMAAMFTACFFHDGLTVLLLRDLVFSGCLFCLSLVDLDVMEIPDGCLIIAALAWVCTAFPSGMEIADILLHLAAGLVFGAGVLGVSLLMDKLLGKESLGGGDVKLIAVCGLYLGFAASLFMMIFSCFIGLGMIALQKNKRVAIPFGPAISAAAWFMLLFGAELTGWYMGLL